MKLRNLSFIATMAVIVAYALFLHAVPPDRGWTHLIHHSLIEPVDAAVGALTAINLLFAVLCGRITFCGIIVSVGLLITLSALLAGDDLMIAGLAIMSFGHLTKLPLEVWKASGRLPRACRHMWRILRRRRSPQSDQGDDAGRQNRRTTPMP